MHNAEHMTMYKKPRPVHDFNFEIDSSCFKANAGKSITMMYFYTNNTLYCKTAKLFIIKSVESLHLR